MQGNCSHAPPLALDQLDSVMHVPLRDMNPGQCLVLVGSGFIELFNFDLWLDNLYLRLHKAGPDDNSNSMKALVDGHNGGLWITNVTMQGDGDNRTDCRDCGAAFLSSVAYIEGSIPVMFFAYVRCVLQASCRICASALNRG